MVRLSSIPRLWFGVASTCRERVRWVPRPSPCTFLTWMSGRLPRRGRQLTIRHPDGSTKQLDISAQNYKGLKLEASVRWRKSAAASRAAAAKPLPAPPAPANVGASRPTATPNLPPPELDRAVAERVPGVVATGGGRAARSRCPVSLTTRSHLSAPSSRSRRRRSVGPAGRDDRQAVGRPDAEPYLRVGHETAAATPVGAVGGVEHRPHRRAAGDQPL